MSSDSEWIGGKVVEAYGKELILDLHGCNPLKFTRNCIQSYMERLCDVIDMKRGPLHFWDYECGECGELYQKEYDKAPNHLKGTTAIQFIYTSNITIHTLDVLKKVFLNIFSCKDFSETSVKNYSINFFQGTIVKAQEIERL